MALLSKKTREQVLKHFSHQVHGYLTFYSHRLQFVHNRLVVQLPVANNEISKQLLLDIIAITDNCKCYICMDEHIVSAGQIGLELVDSTWEEVLGIVNN